ncbi:MAG: ChbG/HpnK family deacetylase [Ignavibacterium album]|uniref:ChbG/HpnK family deacetylase n=1 Tax=Ignavibacterium album TaxID=591197 RepID=UPI0026EAE60A|nr:ChbG/HpnK family deacetylase [Ignavibacterium album]MBI5661805.1 ChbG/HpnK family deacetylase [Ignavibacterium album]
MKILFISVLILISFDFLIAQNVSEEKLLLIRCDDIGMSHSVNLAAKELIASGLKFSASVIVPCGWFDEAVSILKDAENVSIGVHLTLNSEWKNYRWGPVAGVCKVPSLVDSLGYFFPSRAKFFANNPSPEEVETELRAQIEKAFKAGLKISYLDYHMGTAVDKPEMRKIVEKLASEYHLAISRYFGEIDVNSMYSIPVELKYNHLVSVLDSLETEKINLLVCHIGKDNDELSALIDLNEFGLKEMSRHREAELNALLKAVLNNLFKERKIKLLNYSDLIKLKGLDQMKSPIDSGY